MAEYHTIIKTLSDKRADLVRQIEEHQAAQCQLELDIESIDAAMRLFGSPGKSLEATYPRYRKEVARLVLSTLRDAERPMTTLEVAERLIIARQADLSDDNLVKTTQRRVAGCLRHYRRRGVLVSRENIRGRLEWSIP